MGRPHLDDAIDRLDEAARHRKAVRPSDVAMVVELCRAVQRGEVAIQRKRGDRWRQALRLQGRTEALQKLHRELFPGCRASEAARGIAALTQADENEIIARHGREIAELVGTVKRAPLRSLRRLEDVLRRTWDGKS
jgi:hypothetical protein